MDFVIVGVLNQFLSTLLSFFYSVMGSMFGFIVLIFGAGLLFAVIYGVVRAADVREV